MNPGIINFCILTQAFQECSKWSTKFSTSTIATGRFKSHTALYTCKFSSSQWTQATQGLSTCVLEQAFQECPKWSTNFSTSTIATGRFKSATSHFIHVNWVENTEPRGDWFRRPTAWKWWYHNIFLVDTVTLWWTRPPIRTHFSKSQIIHLDKHSLWRCSGKSA